MLKTLIQISCCSLALLWLSGCAEHPWSVADYREAQLNGIRVFCEGRVSCLDHLNERAEACADIMAGHNPDVMTEQQWLHTTGEYSLCLMEGVDQQFIDRMNHLVPIKETNTTFRIGPDMSDPGILEVRLVAGVIQVAGVPVAKEQLVEYLKTHQLADQYHTVALTMNEQDMDVGLMIAVMDRLKAAGLEQISVVPQ